MFTGPRLLLLLLMFMSPRLLVFKSPLLLLLFKNPRLLMFKIPLLLWLQKPLLLRLAFQGPPSLKQHPWLTRRVTNHQKVRKELLWASSNFVTVS